jgi:DNA modification methylase
MVDLYLGDCRDYLRSLSDSSVDSIVTDPPYGLSFMGNRWDYDVPSADVWAECLRVLKPGGHLLAFAGTRTQHRMAVNIEDAGFEIRDMIAWVYSSGFPKSLDVSKAIDKAGGAGRGPLLEIRRDLWGEREEEIVDRRYNEPSGIVGVGQGERSIVERRLGPPATDAARQWSGWGTALKPALEPITVARKPLCGTVAENVLEHWTGGLNIDGCRVETAESLNGGAYAQSGGRHESQSLRAGSGMNQPGKTAGIEFTQPTGRWPANLIHDGSEEALAGFPYSESGNNPTRRGGLGYHGAAGQEICHAPRGANSGSAARFFYCAKASRSDRGEGNTHPTVKPTALMRYLVRLVTPPGGLVLDPFMGSGSTGKAAALEGFRFAGCEMDPGYLEIARARIAHAETQRAEAEQQLELFGG